MANSTGSILQILDLTTGPSAINYTAGAGTCPFFGFHCATVSGGGTIKITPYSSTICTVGATSGGTGARLRITTDANGGITGVEIGASGSGYPAGAPVTVTLSDPFGSGGVIAATAATGGFISSASVVSAGVDYSGYIGLSYSTFIVGVNYDWMPRFIEATGSGSITLIGYKAGYVPYQSY